MSGLFALPEPEWSSRAQDAEQWFLNRGSGPASMVSWDIAMRMCALYGAFKWNASLDAAAEECRDAAAMWDDDCYGSQCRETARVIERRILALKKGGTQ